MARSRTSGFVLLAALATLAFSEASAQALRATVVSKTTDAAPGQTAKSSIACPAGTALVGGGFAIDEVFDVIAAVPTGNAKGFSVLAKNNSTGPRPLRAYAVCLRRRDVSTKFFEKTGSVPSGDIHQANAVNAQCGQGVATGGGFGWASYPNVHASMPLHGGWTAGAANTSGVATPLVSSVICLQGMPSLTTSTHQKEVSVGAGSTTVEVKCPSGKTRLGGGFFAIPIVRVLESAPAENGWRVKGVRVKQEAAILRAIAVCGS